MRKNSLGSWKQEGDDARCRRPIFHAVRKPMVSPNERRAQT